MHMRGNSVLFCSNELIKQHSQRGHHNSQKLDNYNLSDELIFLPIDMEYDDMLQIFNTSEYK